MSISSSFFSKRLHHRSIYLKKRSQVIVPFFHSALIPRRWNTFYLWRKRKRERRRRRKSVWRSIRCEQRATGARDPSAPIRSDMEPTTGSSKGYINNHRYTSIERHPLFFYTVLFLTKRDCLKMLYTLYTAVLN